MRGDGRDSKLGDVLLHYMTLLMEDLESGDHDVQQAPRN